MPVLFAPILAWFGSLGAKFVTDSLLKFVAYKAFAFTLLTVTFPIVIKNLLTWLFELLTSYVTTIDLGDLSATVVNLTGLGAYLAQHLQLVDSLSIILTAIAIRFTLNFIPFIG